MSYFETGCKQNFLGHVFRNRSILQNCSFIFSIKLQLKNIHVINLKVNHVELLLGNNFL